MLLTGHGGIKAAYCTDLFLIIWSIGLPDHPSSLDLIPRPPGGEQRNGDLCRVRSQAAQYQVYKIPLNNTDTYGGAGNGFSPIFSPGGGSRIPSVTRLGLAALPKAGAIGVAANGVPIYPSFDNADYVVWEVCEGDACSSHAGAKQRREQRQQQSLTPNHWPLPPPFHLSVL